MNSSPEIKDLAAALVKAQAAMPTAKKDKANPFFKSSYADLASVWHACREPLTKNGLAVIQTTDLIEGVLTLETTLVHTSGQWISGRLPIVATKNDPQAQGSALSYGKRYALAAMVGVVAEDEDDDAEGAKDRGNGHQPAKDSSHVAPVAKQEPQISTRERTPYPQAGKPDPKGPAGKETLELARKVANELAERDSVHVKDVFEAHSKFEANGKTMKFSDPDGKSEKWVLSTIDKIGKALAAKEPGVREAAELFDAPDPFA